MAMVMPDERNDRLNRLRAKIRVMLRDRSHTVCDHCERQYDDSTCDLCFANQIIKAMQEVVF